MLELATKPEPVYERNALTPTLSQPMGEGERLNVWDGFGGGVLDIGSATRMRIRNWTALFNEIAFIFWHTGYAKDGHYMNIWLGPEERQYVRVMQEFVGRLDKEVRMAKVTASDAKAVRGYGLASKERAAVYLHHFADHTNVVRNLTVSVEVPKGGTGCWLAPETGAVLRQFSVPAGRATLEVPPFRIDMALLVRPAEPNDQDQSSAQRR